MMEWTHLPKYEHHSGFGTKLSMFVGCEGYITPGDLSHFCLFRKIGYELDGTYFSPGGKQYHPECIKVGKTFKTRLVRATLSLKYPPPPSHDSFPLHLRGMYHQGRPWTGTYLDIRRYPAINARRDAPHRYGARLGFIDVSGDSKVPWSAQQFRVAISGRNTASNFSRRPQSPSPPGRPSFLCCGAYWSTLSRRPGRRERESSTTLPEASSRRPLPTTLGENAPIPRSHVPG
jgi:hypothetical protein